MCCNNEAIKLAMEDSGGAAEEGKRTTKVWEGEAEAKVTERKAKVEAEEGTIEAPEAVSKGEWERCGREEVQEERES